MSANAALLEKRAALKREILANREKILPTLILNKIDLAICKTVRRKAPLPWIYSAIVFAILSILPTLLARVMFKETVIWGELIKAESTAIEAAVVGFVALHFVIGFILRDIDIFLIEAIESGADLDDLRQWLAAGWEQRNPGKFIIGGALAWTLVSTVYLSLTYGRFVGVGFVLAAIFVGGVLGLGLYYLAWAIKLPSHLAGYTYKLHDVDPVHSEIIDHLTHMLSGFVYSVAAFFTLASLVDVLIGGAEAQVVVVILALGWGIITTQFVVNQRALRKIVSTAKWKTLNEIQAEIRVLRTGGKLIEKETTDAINRLMDLHERIRNTQSSPLDLKAGLNFLNQLMLPLLGFLLANLDKMLKIFTK